MDDELDAIIDQSDRPWPSQYRNDMGPPQLPFERDTDQRTLLYRTSSSLDIVGVGNQFHSVDQAPEQANRPLKEASLATLYSPARVPAGSLSDITRPSRYPGHPRNRSLSELPPIPTPESSLYNVDTSFHRPPTGLQAQHGLRVPSSYASSLRSFGYARSDRTGFYTASPFGDAVTEESDSGASDDGQVYSNHGQENREHETTRGELRGAEGTSTWADGDSNPETFYDSIDKQSTGAQHNFMRLRLIFCLRWWGKIFKLAMRPSLPAHGVRITWTCECGEDMYADMSDADPRAVEQLSDALNTGSRRDHSTTQPFSGVPTIPRPAHMQNTQLAGNYSTNQHSLSNLGGHGISTETTNLVNPPSFLELCINTGQSCQSLGEVELSLLSSDTMLFESVRQRYKQIRGWRIRKHFLLRPTAIKFVSFGLEQRRKVHIFNEPSLPSAADVAAATWHYEPCPPNPPPLPMPSSAFIHYLTQCNAEPDPFGRAVWLRRLPKKLNEPLLKTTDDLAAAWGIHIVEGPDPVKIMWTMFCLLAICIGPILAYAVLKQDIQGATGIMSIYLAVMTMVGTVIIFFQQKEG